MQSAFPSTVRRYQYRLQTTPWRSLIGCGIAILFYGAIVSFLLPTAWQRPFLRSLLAIPLVLIVLKDLACYPMGIARWKAAALRGASSPERLATLLPPELLGYMRLEQAMWQGFFGWLLRRPHPVPPAGRPLHYLERGSYGTLICCTLVALFVEVPLDVLIASVLTKSPEQLRMLHIVFGVLVAWSFVWVLGDRWQVLGRRHHVLTEFSLELDIGARGFGSIPLAAIARCERLKESRADWCKRHGYLLHATRKLTPFDAPNVVLLLEPGVDVRLTLLQVEQGGDGPIFLYLDRPELLSADMHKLTARLERN
jgi:hypothetical protein